MTKLTSTGCRGADDEARFGEVAALIDQARLRAVRAVNRELIDLYWQIGQYVSEKLAEGAWGQSVVAEFSAYVQARYRGIQGFSASNIWRMRQFYETYQANVILAPLVREISWSHNLLILGATKTDEAREFYLRLAIRDHYSKRELERQIDAMLFERTMLSNETNRLAISRHPELAALRDSYLLEFLDLPEQHSESQLRDSIAANLRDFILEFGKDFSFVGQEYRLQVGVTDFFVDLLFFHRGLSCLVAVELKIGRFKPEYLGQLNFYLEALDRDVRKPDENPSVGLVLCSARDDTVVEYALSRSLSPALVAEYWLALPDKAILQDKLRELRDIQAADN
ncbi:MAG: PDDEXK nuclease domain-containing protein [Azoarcus sp.]|jgi:predicted nuclease of restriction endonuclease-like (RecB) superfamily|nr:PDDEXK nuclease domain-containing protein [Azoarcus sp.]